MISKTKRGVRPIDEPDTPEELAEALTGLDEIKMGPELIDEVIKEPTIDFYLDRSWKLNTPQDIVALVHNLQRKRAAFITVEQKKKEPKIEGEE